LEGRSYCRIARFNIRLSGNADDPVGGIKAANPPELPKLIVGIKYPPHFSGAVNTTIL
jgi:hypothetical protein